MTVQPHTDIIRIDKDFTYSFDAGRITLFRRRQVIATGALQAGKAIIAAVHELEAHRTDHLSLNADAFVCAGTTSRLQLGKEMGLNVNIEGGKYAFKAAQAGAFSVVNQHLLRHGKEWINSDELEQKAFWFALATALHNARRRTTALLATAAESNIEVPADLKTADY